MASEDVATVLSKLIHMVSGVEQATAAVLEVLIENGTIERDVLLRGLAEKRRTLDPKYSSGMLDMLIDKLSGDRSGELH
jgi:hypothetical protein